MNTYPFTLMNEMPLIEKDFPKSRYSKKSKRTKGFDFLGLNKRRRKNKIARLERQKQRK